MSPRATKKPVSKKPRAQAHARRPPKAKKIRRSALEEYQESIAEDGVTEVVSLEDEGCLANVRGWVSTGSIELDLLLNGGGIPFGRVVEIVGPEHIGKSTLLDMIFGNVQKIGGVGVLAEPEISRDREYSARLGVNLRELQYLQFPKAEFVLERIFNVFERTIDWWATKQPDTPVVIGLDALAGTATHSEMESGLGLKEKAKRGKKSEESVEGESQKMVRSGEQPGEAAKYMAKVARQFPVRLGGTKISMIILNHEYSKMGVMGMGQRTESYGGRALRRMASIRIRMYSKGEWIYVDGRRAGRVAVARLEKNRLGNPWGEVYLPIISGYGVDNCWSLYHGLIRTEVAIVSGSWTAVNLSGEVLKFQGWRGLSNLVTNRPEIFDKLVGIYRERMLPQLAAAKAGPSELTGLPPAVPGTPESPAPESPVAPVEEAAEKEE